MHLIFTPRQRCAAIASTAVLAASPIAFGQVAVDLNTWSEKGPPGNGNWTVAADGSNVFQSINGNPTFFVSPNDFSNTTVQGSFGVETTGDDDFIGFVFGYQTPQGTGTDFDFLLFDWKQGNQSGSTAGFTLSYVNGDNPQLFNNHQTSQTGYNVLATDVGTGRGWVDNTVYGFDLTYRDDRITIGIDGGAFDNETIFDVAINDVDPNGTLFGGAFPEGQFGFYNYSQASVRYQSFTQADDPVLTTTPGDGGTLAFPSVRAGSGNSSTGSVIVQNSGGVGSNLTGAAGAASGAVFGGPGGSFNLGEGESTSFDYTFTPAARGTVTDTLVVDGDDPAGDSTITLSGTGVGPVTQITGDDAGTFDFGTIGSDETATLELDLANVTPDTGDLALVGLTVDFEITGADAEHFELVLTPGTEFDAGDAETFDLIFDPQGLDGTFTATLTFLTDQNAAFGDTINGDTFTYSLVANALIPEPTSLALLGLGGGLFLRRRRA